MASPVSLAEAFLGCLEEGSLAAHVCLESVVACQSCLALDATDGVSDDCDRLDDGAANGSCLPLTCSQNPLTVSDPDGNAIELADGGRLQLHYPIAPNPTPTDNSLPDRGMDRGGGPLDVAPMAAGGLLLPGRLQRPETRPSTRAAIAASTTS